MDNKIKVLRGENMKAVCTENKLFNSNFTVGKIYDMNKNGIRTDWGGIFTPFEDYDKPSSFNVGTVFDFGMCKFEIVST